MARRPPQQLDAAGDVAERRPVDAEDAHRPRLDAPGRRSSARSRSRARRTGSTRRTGRPASGCAARPARTRAWVVDGGVAVEQRDRLLEERGSRSRCRRPARPRSRAARARARGARGRRSAPGAASTSSIARWARSTAREASPTRVAVALAASNRSARSRSAGRSSGAHEVPQLDRALVLAAGLGVGVDRPRGVAGRDRRRAARGSGSCAAVQ